MEMDTGALDMEQLISSSIDESFDLFKDDITAEMLTTFLDDIEQSQLTDDILRESGSLLDCAMDVQTAQQQPAIKTEYTNMFNSVQIKEEPTTTLSLNHHTHVEQNKKPDPTYNGSEHQQQHKGVILPSYNSLLSSDPLLSSSLNIISSVPPNNGLLTQNMNTPLHNKQEKQHHDLLQQTQRPTMLLHAMNCDVATAAKISAANLNSLDGIVTSLPSSILYTTTSSSDTPAIVFQTTENQLTLRGADNHQPMTDTDNFNKTNKFPELLTVHTIADNEVTHSNAVESQSLKVNLMLLKNCLFHTSTLN